MLVKRMAGNMVHEENEYGDGVAWIRGPLIGKGSFGRVYLATPKNPRSKYSCLPPVMAVKSAEVSMSGSIQKEVEILNNFKGCPNIIRCLGEETTMSDNSVMAYNLLLEYGSGGTLADRITKSDGTGLPEMEVRVYAKSILRGLYHIHSFGYVHCDLKPDNILLVPKAGRDGITEFRAKIGDFGLAKKANQSRKRKLEPYWRGTPMYLSPEAVIDKVQEAPGDVWALGCIVLEMLTGKAPWDLKSESRKADEVLGKIGKRNELPQIPSGISKEAKDFLKGCFVRKSAYRFTTEMLLSHAFVEGLDNDDSDGDDEDEDEDLEETVVSDSDGEFDCGFSSDECDSLSCSSVDDEVVCNSGEEIEGVMGSSIDSGLDGSEQSLWKRRKQFHYPGRNLAKHMVRLGSEK